MANDRHTHQRAIIREVFAGSDRPLSTQEILLHAQRHKATIGLATVYRTLKLLLQQGWLTTVRMPGEPTRYEIAGKPHHHHFYCRVCGRVFEVPGNDALLEAMTPRGFALESHDLVLNGRCATCVQRRARARASMN